MFKVGEYIIYKRDLCKITGIENNPKNNEKYYALSPVKDESLSIKVPVSNKFNLLRYPLTKDEAEKLISKIPEIKPIETSDKLLENAYRELMKTNKHEDLIKIIKTTYLRNQDRLSKGKKESEKDINYFYQAEICLYNELGYALGKNYEECKNYIIKNIEKKDSEK